MNPVLLTADIIHMIAVCSLILFKFIETSSASGISYKSQYLYVIVFCTRYVDLLFFYVSLYNVVMKIFFICTSIYICYLIKYKFKDTWESSLDTFKIKYLIIPSCVLALIFTYEYSFLEILWTFSIFLEAVAILPQFSLMQNTGEFETIIIFYLFTLGSYRAIYVLKWIIFDLNQNKIYWNSLISGIIQTSIYIFYLFKFCFFNTKKCNTVKQKQEQKEESKEEQKEEQKQESKEEQKEESKQSKIEYKRGYYIKSTFIKIIIKGESKN